MNYFSERLAEKKPSQSPMLQFGSYAEKMRKKELEKERKIMAAREKIRKSRKRRAKLQKASRRANYSWR